MHYGADADLKSQSDHIYPLHLCIFYNQPTICKLLLDNECNLDILYNDMSIIEILDYLQFKSAALSQFDLNRFRNIITNSNQFKQWQGKQHKIKKSDNSNHSTPQIIASDEDDDDDDDEGGASSPFWKKYLTAGQSAENEEQTENKYTLHSDDDEDEESVNESLQIKQKYFDDSDANDSDDAVGDIMNFLQKDHESQSNIINGADVILEEESSIDDESENEEKTEALLIVKEEQTEQNEHGENKNDLKVASEQNEEIKTVTNSADSIISIDLNRLFDSMKHRFVAKSEFEEFKQNQLRQNEMIQVEQSQSLKELIDVNQEINDLNIGIKECDDNINTMQSEMNEEINAINGKINDLVTLRMSLCSIVYSGQRICVSDRGCSQRK